MAIRNTESRGIITSSLSHQFFSSWQSSHHLDQKISSSSSFFLLLILPSTSCAVVWRGRGGQAERGRRKKRETYMKTGIHLCKIFHLLQLIILTKRNLTKTYFSWVTSRYNIYQYFIKFKKEMLYNTKLCNVISMKKG